MRIMSSLVAVLSLLATRAWLPAGDEWQHPLSVSGGGWWAQRIRVQFHNGGDAPAAGEPVAVAVGTAADQAALVGARVEALRVVDRHGVEMLSAVYGPDNAAITSGAIPAGATLVLPAECPASGSNVYFVYFDNPAAWPVPDTFHRRTSVFNGDFEAGSGDTPDGWRHDPADAQHRATWSTESPQSGKRCVKTVVADSAEPTWIATRQAGIHIVGGAKYRMRAWVKAANVRGQAGWYIHVGNERQPMMLAPVYSAGDGTFAWREVTAEFTAPAEADLADLGTVLRGTGTAWFDHVTLERLTPGKIRATVSPPERLALKALGANAPWHDAARAGAPRCDFRFAASVVNVADCDLTGALTAFDLRQLDARLHGRLNRSSLTVVVEGRPVPSRVCGHELLAEVPVPARSVVWCYVYCNDDPGKAPTVGQPRNAADAVKNLVQDPSFEATDGPSSAWTATGSSPDAAGVKYGRDDPGRADLGLRCARMDVPETAPKAWRGWHQTVPVRPGRTYLLSATVRCRGVAGGVQVHAHAKTADGALCRQNAMLGVGPAIRGETDWTLLAGHVTMPADAAFLQIHLTMDQTGTVWHDEVALYQVVGAGPVRLEGWATEDTGKHQSAGEGRGPAGGSRRNPPTLVWPVPAVVKVFQDDPPPRQALPAQIAAARNECEPLQLAVRAPRDFKSVRIEVDPPAGPGGFALKDIETTVVGYVPIDHPTDYYQAEGPAWHRKLPRTAGHCDGWAGLWPDPLLPQTTVRLEAGKTQPIWLTVRVPKDAPAGEYAGALRLVADGATIAATPWRVRVWDFTLPDENHVAAIYDARLGPGGALWGQPFEAAYPAMIRFMASRRLCPDTIHPAPVFRRENGRVTADFAAFDRAAAVYFDELRCRFAYTPWDLYLFGWGHPPKTVFGEHPYPGDPPFAAADRSRLRPEYKRAYQDMLRLFWDHVKEKGWSDRIILYISDEPFDTQEPIRAQMKALCAMIHEVDPRIPIYCSTWNHIPEWNGALNVWGLGHDGRVPVKTMAERQAAGDRIWFTTDGQMCTDTPYCAVERLLPHYCFQYGAEAYEFWGAAWHTYDPYRFGWHAYIHQSDTPGKSYWIRYPNGDGFILYPGAPLGLKGIVSSVRCEQAREGVEDYEYLYLLRKLTAAAKTAGRDVTAAEQALSAAAGLVAIPNPGGRYSTQILPNPERLYSVRQQLAAAIESLAKASGP